MAVTQLRDILMAANYKPCRKKQYEIWACIPPAGTLLVNKLEQADVLAQLRKMCPPFRNKEYITADELAQIKAKSPDMYNWLAQHAQAGRLYQTKAGEVVLSGTRGEMWITSAQKVMSQYQVFANGVWGMNWQSVTESRGVKIGDQFLLSWTKIRAKGDVASTTMACFVPKKISGQLNAGWAMLSFNLARVEHGNGDFIICGKTAKGTPDIPRDTKAPGNWWVVNGAVFADTYNNQGWTEELKGLGGGMDVVAPEPAPLFSKPTEVEVTFDKDLYNFIGQMAQKCSSAQHNELSFKVMKSEVPNEILIQAKTVMDFASKNSLSKDEITVVGVSTKVTVNSDNSVTIVNKLVHRDAADGATMFKIVVPEGHKNGVQEDPMTVRRFFEQNGEIIFGLCGFVRETGVRSSFAYRDQITKADYDGIRDYTMTSGATNRLLRGLSSAGEKSGEGRAQAIRVVANCDSLFDKVVTTRPLRVFRGEPYEQRVADNGANFNDLTGFKSVNTAYSSTTLNVQSAPMFAKHTSPVNGIKGGIIWAIELPPGTRAHFSHTVAGWKEQFEILLDRCYDIVAAGEIMSFKDSDGCTYKVVKGQIVPHQPMGALDQKQSAMLYKTGQYQYDERGKVPFSKEYSDGILHTAFNKIRSRGFSDVQWQDAYDSDNEVVYASTSSNTRTTSEIIGKHINVKAAIVLRVNNPDSDKSGQHTDLAFTFDRDSRMLTIHKVRVNTSARQNHSNAEGLRWSQYGLGYMKFDTVRDKNGNVTQVTGGSDINELDTSLYEREDKRQIWYLKDGSDEEISNEIASKIINYAKTHKNICILPLLDIARYFDQVFASVINREGYELMRSIRVERHYNKASQAEANDPQAGFVPCKYQITGDNDDHLVIDVKFERDKATGKLKISYRGQSQGTKVNESKALTVSIFNNGKMTSLAESIIYTFAKRMHLSKARKFDRLLEYFCRQTGCTMVRTPQKDASLKTYKVWGVDRKSNFTVDITKQDVEHYQCCIEFDDGRIALCDMDFSNTIWELSRQFGQAIMGGDEGVSA